jgi:membrane fusion protein, multidrug efflux system
MICAPTQGRLAPARDSGEFTQTAEQHGGQVVQLNAVRALFPATVRPGTLLRAASLALGTLLMPGCSKEAPVAQRPAPQVTVVTVAPQTIPYAMTFVAQTESSRQVDIVARVSGFLDQIAYREGELVQEGQLLFQIDPKPFQAQLEAARGELMAQQARHTTATSNLRRIKPLAQQNAVSQADLDRAQGEFDASKAAVFAAQAKVKEAQLNLGYTTIRSPLTGLASRSQQRQGAYLNAMSESAKLTYVAAIDPIWVNFSVSQNQMAQITRLTSSGAVLAPRDHDYQVKLVMSDGSVYPDEGKINFAAPNFSQETGSFLVRAVFPNPKRALRPGMFVSAIVQGSKRPNAILIPQLAVQQGSNGHIVYVVKADGTAELRPVVVGDYYGEKDIVIVSGLRAGDRVVAEGALKVVSGQPVKIVVPGTAAAGKAGGAAGKAAKAGETAKK